ncbi:MAG: ion channel [Desulfobulbaceae bacterium]|nr:ion channel [Desulfobulbaceae bacterium]
MFRHKFRKRIRQFRHENKELIATGLLFLFAFLIFNTIMVFIEKMDLLSSFYFSFVTATTVGYGDISPSTPLGRWTTVAYMLVSIGALGTAIGVATTKATKAFDSKKRGLLTVKDRLDLVIIGYPSESKVKDIVQEFRLDPRFSDAVVAVITDKLDERPTWMAAEDVFFVKGVASKREILEQANITSARRVLVLAEDPTSEISDEYSSSAVIMSERLNPSAYTIAEKVREDGYLFEIAECDLVVSVSRAGELVQELQDPGAIEFSECIFSNKSKGNQYNAQLRNATTWKDIALSFIEEDCIAIGYKNPEDKKFSFAPAKNTLVRQNALIKYIAQHPIRDHDLVEKHCTIPGCTGEMKPF